MMSNKENVGSRPRIIWTIAAKDIVDALKNKTILTVMLGLALTMATSQALPLLLKLRSVPSAVVYDPGTSPVIEAMSKGREFSLRQVSSLEEAELWMAEASEVILGLALPNGFDESVDDETPIILEGFVVHWAAPQKVAELEAFFQAQFSQEVGRSVSIVTREDPVYPKPDSGGRPFMVSVTFVIATVMVGAFLVPYLMIEERETHTIDSLLVSPATYTEVVVGKAAAGTFYCLAAMTVMFFFNRAVVNLWGLMLLTTICGALFTVALGLLMGILFDNAASLNLWLGLIIMVLLLPLFFFGSMAANIPDVIRGIVPWIPSVAMAELFRTSLSNDLALATTLPNLAIVLAYAIILLTLVVWRVRQLDK